jgi:hypothetical protein
MSDKETLTFKITLGATFWDKLPEYSIHVNDEQKDFGQINPAGQTIVEFDHNLSEGQNFLKIRLNNKESSDTVVDQEKIVNDMLLNIEDITIDGLSLGNLIRNSSYYPDHPQLYQGKTVDSLEGCVNLGWNGAYVLEFRSPFYMWLLENL